MIPHANPTPKPHALHTQLLLRRRAALHLRKTPRRRHPSLRRTRTWASRSSTKGSKSSRGSGCSCRQRPCRGAPREAGDNSLSRLEGALIFRYLECWCLFSESNRMGLTGSPRRPATQQICAQISLNACFCFLRGLVYLGEDEGDWADPLLSYSRLAWREVQVPVYPSNRAKGSREVGVGHCVTAAAP